MVEPAGAWCTALPTRLETIMRKSAGSVCRVTGSSWVTSVNPRDAVAPAGQGQTGTYDLLDAMDHTFDDAGKELFARCLTVIEPWSEDRGHWISIIGAGLRGWGLTPQKLALAKVLHPNPKVVVLDEPTRGVDVGAKFDIYALIRDMTAKGMAVILVSTDLSELIGLSDRIAVMRAGQIAEIVPAKGLGEDELIKLCYGRAGRAA